MPDSVTLAKRFDSCLMQQFNLCHELELLADSLPSRVDTSAALLLADRLHPTLRRCHALEETMIFPVLKISQNDVTSILYRLQSEHVEDQDHAHDVCEAVKSLVAHEPTCDAEKTGYMLRGLFVSLRRHLAFDQDFVLPLYRRSCGL